MTQRPLCIDSKVVESIDRLAAAGTETIYRCALNKETPFSAYFNQNAKLVEDRIQSMERVLESLEPFFKKVNITVVEDRPYLFRVQRHHVYIGEKLFLTPGHLEKALAKIWYRERNDLFFHQQTVMEEVVTDFLLFLNSGSVKIVDPVLQTQTDLAEIRWPSVIKSVDEYCNSPWRTSEHYVTCMSPADRPSLATDVNEISLRPLLATAWVRSYMSLGMKERYEFSKMLPQFLRSERQPELKLTNDLIEKLQDSSMATAATTIRDSGLFVSNSVMMKQAPSLRQFSAGVTNELRASGYTEAFAEAAFDVLFVQEQKLTEDSAQWKHFSLLAKANPKLQMAVRDSENLWMLPSKFPIALSSFGKIRANKTIVEKCGEYNFNYVLEFAERTEKLLIADNCNAKQELKYQKMLSDGAEGFGLENPATPFVQFHLPSLLMRKEELAQVNNVFDFIQKRDVENSSFKSLGWQEVRWLEPSHVYKPKAFVDAIEVFRVPN
jgi:hypothetical protein